MFAVARETKRVKKEKRTRKKQRKVDKNKSGSKQKSRPGKMTDSLFAFSTRRLSSHPPPSVPAIILSSSSNRRFVGRDVWILPVRVAGDSHASANVINLSLARLYFRDSSQCGTSTTGKSRWKRTRRGTHLSWSFSPRNPPPRRRDGLLCNAISAKRYKSPWYVARSV